MRRSFLAELRQARMNAGLSQRKLAKLMGWSQSRFSEFERDRIEPTITSICELASLLGFRASLDLHPLGEPIRDAGHIRLLERFRRLLADAWQLKVEAPFPTLGDLRSWDALIRLGASFRAGVECETRLRDLQAFVRRIRQREIHGGADAVLVVLSDSTHNRRFAEELRAALGPACATLPGTLIAALRAGQPLPGSGVILL